MEKLSPDDATLSPTSLTLVQEIDVGLFLVNSSTQELSIAPISIGTRLAGLYFIASHIVQWLIGEVLEGDLLVAPSYLTSSVIFCT